MHILNFGLGQKLGQDVSFRESFDVAVARAVAEMRILGKQRQFFLLLLCFMFVNICLRLLSVSVILQLSIAFL